MKNRTAYTVAHGLTALIAFAILLGNVALVYGVDAFGSPFLFAGALVAEVFFLIIFIYSLIRALRTPLHVLATIGVSAWQGILRNTYSQQLAQTKSLALSWIGSRLTPLQPTGLLLSSGIALTLVFLAWFGNILYAVSASGPLTQTDLRVLNLMPVIRTPLQTDFFRFITFTANPESLILTVILMVIIFGLRKQWVACTLVIGATFVEQVCAFSIKQFVGRSRPDHALSLIRVSDFSFPSGHALSATVLFGMLAYFSFRAYKTSFIKLAIALGYVVSVGLVALSRVYLGVHYPTDVIAGMLFGGALLTLLITSVEVITRAHCWHSGPESFENRQLLGIVPLLIIWSLIVSPFVIHPQVLTQRPHYTMLSSMNAQTVIRLPKTSETLTGKVAEPIDFIYVGSQTHITHLFLDHGWYKADPSTLADTLQAFSVGFQGRQYLTAPVTPFYVYQRPEAMAFEQPTQANTLRQRHHTRIWKTGYLLPTGQEVWVGTASFDESIAFTGLTKLPTHHISPDLDAERSYIIQSLGMSSVTYIPLNRAQAGQNAAGDIFFTDGRAAVLTL